MFSHIKTLSPSLTLSTIISTLFLSACGGGGSSSNDISDVTEAEPRQVTTSDWQSSNLLAREDASGLTIEEQGSQLKFTITNLDIVSGKHTQIYLDTDNNPDTGYRFDNTAWAVTGVDYILENDFLFKSTTDDSSWSWNTNVGEVTSYTRTDTSIEIIVEKSLFKGACNNINAGTMARDEDWQISSFYPVANMLRSYPISPCDNVIDTTPPVLTLKGSNPLYVPEDSPYFNDPGATAIDNVDGDISANIQVTSDYFETHGELVDLSLGDTETELRYSVTDNAGNTAKITRTVIVDHRSGSHFTVDGDNREWGHIAPLIQANEGTLKVVDDLADDNNTSDDTVVLLLETPSLGENIQIYLDTDNNSETGYPLYDATIPNVVAGADFLIENGHLNKSLSNTFQWNWEYDTPLSAHPRFEYARNGDLVEIKIPRHLITSDKIKINIVSIDATWQQAGWFNDMTPAIFKLLSTSVVPNNAPVAVDDITSMHITRPGTGKRIHVLDNDIDSDGDSLKITQIGSAQHGRTEDAPENTIAYIPNAGFEGTDKFTYTISDGNGGTDTAVVVVNVTQDINNPPNAVDDEVSFNVPRYSPTNGKRIHVLNNDTDSDGDALKIIGVGSAQNGRTSDAPENTVAYFPNAGFVGTDTFTYTISDGNGGTATAVVTVVATQYSPPIAVDDEVSMHVTQPNQKIIIDVVENDIDPNPNDSFPLRITAVGAAQHGRSDILGNSVSYTPNPGFEGTDNFIYTIHDFDVGTSTAKVTVTVTQVNNSPDAVEDAPATDFDKAITIDVLANDTDPDGDTLSITNVTQPLIGQTTLNSDGTILFDPQNNVGSISFSYTISDGRGGTDSTVVTVASSDPNDGNDNYPIIVNEDVSTPINTAIFIDVLANDSDLDGDTLILDQVDDGSNGTTTKVNGGVLYTPAAGFAGTDSFHYGVHDGHGHNGAGLVTITVKN